MKTDEGLQKEISDIKVALSMIIVDLVEAAGNLKPPFLTLPEGMTAEQAAYRRGAYDAYTKVIAALKEVK